MTEWRRGGRSTGESRFENRKGIITRAARTCFARKGVSKTSIADITREVNITRELFYYYFPSKSVVLDAVVDTYVQDAHEMLADCIGRASEEEGSDVLVQVIGVLRGWMNDDADEGAEGAETSMLEILRETALWQETAYRVADTAVMMLFEMHALGPQDLLNTTTANGRRIALVGAMDVMRTNDRLSDEEVADGIRPLFS